MWTIPPNGRRKCKRLVDQVEKEHLIAGAARVTRARSRQPLTTKKHICWPSFLKIILLYIVWVIDGVCVRISCTFYIILLCPLILSTRSKSTCCYYNNIHVITIVVVVSCIDIGLNRTCHYRRPFILSGNKNMFIRTVQLYTYWLTYYFCASRPVKTHSRVFTIFFEGVFSTIPWTLRPHPHEDTRKHFSIWSRKSENIELSFVEPH